MSHDSEPIYLNKYKKQLILQGYRYQLNTKGQQINQFRCVNRRCWATLSVGSGSLTVGRHKHQHPEMSMCEIDIMIELAKLKERVKDDETIEIHKAYDAIFEELKEKYSEEEIRKTWRDWSKVRGKFEYHQRKAVNSMHSSNSINLIND
jgi:hypothetical protein